MLVLFAAYSGFVGCTFRTNSQDELNILHITHPTPCLYEGKKTRDRGLLVGSASKPHTPLKINVWIVGITNASDPIMLSLKHQSQTNIPLDFTPLRHPDSLDTRQM